MTTVTVTPTATTQAKLKAIVTELTEEFLERRGAIEALAVTVLANANGFLLGPPGTAKSQLIRAFCERVTDAHYFEKLLWPTTQVEEVVGGLDIDEFKRGRYVRVTDGMLPEAHIAYIDEIWKGRSAVLNALLAIANEHIFHNPQPVATPTLSVLGASNELPDSEETAAIFDRFLVRFPVNYIEEPGNFDKLLRSAVAPASIPTTVSLAELEQAVRVEVPALPVSDAIFEAMAKLWTQMRGAGMHPSDRRFKQCVRLVQAHAYLNGRSQCIDEDLIILRYALWETIEQVQPVERMVLTLASPQLKDAVIILESVNELASRLRDLGGEARDELNKFGFDANAKMRTMHKKLKKLRADAVKSGRSTTKLDEIIARHLEVANQVWTQCLGMRPANSADEIWQDK